jgi:hypothetical protein
LEHFTAFPGLFRETVEEIESRSVWIHRVVSGNYAFKSAFSAKMPRRKAAGRDPKPLQFRESIKTSCRDFQDYPKMRSTAAVGSGGWFGNGHGDAALAVQPDGA